MTMGPEIRADGPRHALLRGRRFLFFSGVDYHRLSQHPEVAEAAATAAREYGLGSAGSRLTTGNHPLLLELEREASAFFDSDQARVLPSGYLAPLTAIQALAQEHQMLFVDELTHPSGMDGARNWPVKIVLYRHRNLEDLQAKLQKELPPKKRPLVVTDGVFPITGELAPLDEISLLLEGYGGGLVVDDAHGLAVAGPTGKGTHEAFALSRGARLAQVGSLTKGIGCIGGVVLGDATLAGRVDQYGLPFAASSPLPLPMAAAAMKAMELLRAHPEWLSALHARAVAAKRRLNSLGFPQPGNAIPILSIDWRNPQLRDQFHDRLLERGILPPFSSYPGTAGSGRSRFALSSQHRDEDIDLLLDEVEAFAQKKRMPR